MSGSITLDQWTMDRIREHDNIKWLLRLICDDLVIDRSFPDEKSAKLKAGQWNRKFMGRWSFELYNPELELVASANNESYRLTWVKVK